MIIFRDILVFASLINCFLALYALRYRKSNGALSFSFLMFAASIYAFGYAFELSGNTLESIRFWLSIEYIGIPVIGPLWLIFASAFVGKDRWLKKIYLPGSLLLFALATFIISLTNQYHHLFYRELTLDHIGHLSIATLVKGPWYWIHITVSNLEILIATVLFVEFFRKSTFLYRKQACIMLLGSVAAWIGLIIYLLGYSPYGLDTSPISFAVSGIILTWGMFHLKILDIVPIALERVFESLSESVIILDPQLRIVNYNPASEKILYAVFPDPVGKKIHEGSGEIAAFARQAITDHSQSGTISLILDGQPGFLQASFSPIQHNKGRVIGFVIIFIDITHQMKIEQMLRDKEKKLMDLNATKDKFFNIIAHDLKNPFNSLIGFSEILHHEAHELTTEDVARIGQNINISAVSGYKLLENLLEWARSQTGQIDFAPQEINLTELIRENIRATRNLADTKNITVRLEDPGILLAYADPNMIQTVLRNLLTNAIKFTHPTGMVTVWGNASPSEVTISIRDTGTGISRENIEKLFRLDTKYSTYGTANEKGTGLGLLLCKEFITRNNGSISVKSELGQGSEFRFTLPVALTQ